MKRITKNLSMLIILALSFTACQEDQQKKQIKELQEMFNTTMKETVAIHDEVMPKMSEISKLQSELEEQSPKMNEEEYQRANDELARSYQEMMTWMKEFSNNFDSKEVNSGITTEDIDELKSKNETLNSLKASAEEMRDQMEKSLKYAYKLKERYQ